MLHTFLPGEELPHAAGLRSRRQTWRLAMAGWQAVGRQRGEATGDLRMVNIQ